MALRRVGVGKAGWAAGRARSRSDADRCHDTHVLPACQYCGRCRPVFPFPPPDPSRRSLANNAISTTTAIPCDWGIDPAWIRNPRTTIYWPAGLSDNSFVERCLREVQNGGYTCIIRNSDNALLRCAETSAGSGGTAL